MRPGCLSSYHLSVFSKEPGVIQMDNDRKKDPTISREQNVYGYENILGAGNNCPVNLLYGMEEWFVCSHL